MVASEGKRPEEANKKDVNLICNVLLFINRKRLEANKKLTFINSESKYYSGVCYTAPCSFLHFFVFSK